MIVSNLKHVPYKERFVMKLEIYHLFKSAKDARELSMPLLASAIQGDVALYKTILPVMKKALNAIPEDGEKNSYKTWLLGRVLLAASTVKDHSTVSATLKTLNKLLHDVKTTPDMFSTWGFGYLASINKTEYKANKENMVKGVRALTREYQAAIPEKNPEKTQDALSCALWALVTNLKAAANAHDKETYHDILREIKALTAQQSVSAALTKGLLRSAASNDYPAWALATVSLAAVTIQDKALYEELEKPLSESIKHASEAEHVLARVNAVLAHTLWKVLELEETNKPNCIFM